VYLHTIVHGQESLLGDAGEKNSGSRRRESQVSRSSRLGPVNLSEILYAPEDICEDLVAPCVVDAREKTLALRSGLAERSDLRQRAVHPRPGVQLNVVRDPPVERLPSRLQQRELFAVKRAAAGAKQAVAPADEKALVGGKVVAPGDEAGAPVPSLVALRRARRDVIVQRVVDHRPQGVSRSVHEVPCHRLVSGLDERLERTSARARTRAACACGLEGSTVCELYTIPRTWWTIGR